MNYNFFKTIKNTSLVAPIGGLSSCYIIDMLFPSHEKNQALKNIDLALVQTSSLEQIRKNYLSLFPINEKDIKKHQEITLIKKC